jgi:hypothetical protein
MNKKLIEQMVRKELTKMLKEGEASDAISALGGIRGGAAAKKYAKSSEKSQVGQSREGLTSAKDALVAAFGDIKKDTSKLERSEKETVYKKLILALKKALAGK